MDTIRTATTMVTIPTLGTMVGQIRGTPTIIIHPRGQASIMAALAHRNMDVAEALAQSMVALL